jgi:hypothetical protein
LETTLTWKRFVSEGVGGENTPDYYIILGALLEATLIDIRSVKCKEHRNQSAKYHDIFNVEPGSRMLQDFLNGNENRENKIEFQIVSLNCLLNPPPPGSLA